jgi:hypothetical protein
MPACAASHQSSAEARSNLQHVFCRSCVQAVVIYFRFAASCPSDVFASSLRAAQTIAYWANAAGYVAIIKTELVDMSTADEVVHATLQHNAVGETFFGLSAGKPMPPQPVLVRDMLHSACLNASCSLCNSSCPCPRFVVTVLCFFIG